MNNGTRIQLDRVAPQDIDAERALLGGLMVLDDDQRGSIAECMLLIRGDEVFYRERHNKIWNIIKELFDDDEPVDLLMVTKRLERNGHLEKVGGVPYVNELIDASPSSANVKYYAEMIIEEAIKRQLIYASFHINESAYDNEQPSEKILAEALNQLLELNNSTLPDQVTTKESVKQVINKLQKMNEEDNPIVGLALGIKYLDLQTTGLAGGDLVIVAARPGVGKSTLVQNFGQYVTVEGKKHAVMFSLEMKKELLVTRILASESGIPFLRFRVGKIQEKEWSAVTLAASRLSGAKFDIEDSPDLTPRDVRSHLLRITGKQGKPDLVIIDYLQLMSASKPTGKRVDDITQISRELKILAMSLDIPFIVVSQLNRSVEYRPDKRPQLSDLRESGAIEQDADIVLFIFREDYQSRNPSQGGPCELIIGKQRNGPTGMIPVTFNLMEAKFKQSQRARPDKRTLTLARP